MADTTLEVADTDVLADAIKEFASAHDGASAVVEYVGRRGARIVLAGSDGSSADAFAPATDVARDACREAGIDVVNTWENELFEEIRAQASLW
jgi:fructose-specific phosphotransferase system component IIB